MMMIIWLLKNIPNNNARVGIWGISYPGFYAAFSLIDSHPALKCASPQAPIADWFIGDDFHHNGALYLPHTFRFFYGFGRPRPEPITEAPPLPPATPPISSAPPTRSRKPRWSTIPTVTLCSSLDDAAHDDGRDDARVARASILVPARRDQRVRSSMSYTATFCQYLAQRAWNASWIGST